MASFVVARWAYVRPWPEALKVFREERLSGAGYNPHDSPRFIRARKMRLGAPYRGPSMDRESRLKVEWRPYKKFKKMEDISGACGTPVYIN